MLPLYQPSTMIKNCGTIDEHRKIVEFFEKQQSS